MLQRLLGHFQGEMFSAELLSGSRNLSKQSSVELFSGALAGISDKSPRGAHRKNSCGISLYDCIENIVESFMH